MKNFKRNNSGITLIALVITIIVLLILAGVSIATLTGENGILTRAQDAKTKTEESEDIEKIRLAISEAQIGENGYQELSTDNLASALIKDGTKTVVSDNEDGTKHILFLDKKKEYKLDSNGNIENLNIDFDAKYVSPSSQDEVRNEGVIGIGTDGQPVDMDLWEYTLINNETEYGLNTLNGLDNTGSSGREKGYIGEFTDDGTIIGSVPQYISRDNGKTFLPVTSIVHTFYNCTELKTAPDIPATVKDMNVAFYKASSLEIFSSNIPKGVTSLEYTFASCLNLVTFNSEIPSTITSMRGTFSECSSLGNVSMIISSSVVDFSVAFYKCPKLEGTIIINANLTGAIIDADEIQIHRDYQDAFMDSCEKGSGLIISGNCKLLELLRDGNEKITIQ